MSSAALVVCHECDLLLREVPLEAGGVARCTRCGCNLYRHQPEGLERSLVFALTAVVLFVIANSFPIVSMNSRGLTSSTTLLGAVGVLLHDDMPSVALLVFVTTFLMPALEIGALIYLLLPLKLGRVPPAVPSVFRLLHAVQPVSYTHLDVYKRQVQEYAGHQQHKAADQQVIDIVALHPSYLMLRKSPGSVVPCILRR